MLGLHQSLRESTTEMWFKVISVILLASPLILASLDCDGSGLNIDGFVPRPSEKKAGLGEFPWVVALFKKDSPKPHCAGSIIDESTILTTAFCLKK